MEEKEKKGMETIREYIRYIVTYARDYRYQFIRVKCSDGGFPWVSAIDSFDSMGYITYTPSIYCDEKAISETVAEIMTVFMEKARENHKTLQELAEFCEQDLKRVKKREEQEMFEALNESFRHKKEKKIIEELLYLYGKIELTERLIKYYKANYCGKPYKINYKELTDTLYFKKLIEIFPEWYEDCYLPKHNDPRKKWKEKAKENAVSEEMLQNNISSFFKLMEKIRTEEIEKEKNREIVKEKIRELEKKYLRYYHSADILFHLYHSNEGLSTKPVWARVEEFREFIIEMLKLQAKYPTEVKFRVYSDVSSVGLKIYGDEVFLYHPTSFLSSFLENIHFYCENFTYWD